MRAAFRRRAMASGEAGQLTAVAAISSRAETKRRDRASKGIIIRVVECEVNNYADVVHGNMD